MFTKPQVFSDEGGSYVLGKDGSVKATFTIADHGASHEGAAVAHLQQNFDNYMGEEAEEGNKYSVHKGKEGWHVNQHTDNGVWHHSVQSGYHDTKEKAVAWAKKHAGNRKHSITVSEDIDPDLKESRFSHRDYASHGLMHPDMAKHMKVGHDMDYYLPGTGDKHSGRVTVNNGSSVHIRAEKDGKIGKGPLHKFKVTPHLPKQQNEEAEQIAELSTSTLDSYRNKARTQIINVRNKDNEKTEKRLKGYTKASQKITRNFVQGKEMNEAPFDDESRLHDAHYDKQTERVKNALDNYAMRGMSYKQAYNKIRHSGTHTLRHEITPMSEETDLLESGMKRLLDKYMDKGHDYDTAMKKAQAKLAKQATKNEAVKNPYAVGMAAAEKSTGDKPPLKKSTIVKAHKIAKEVMKENKFLAGALKRLEEGRGRPPKEGSAAWHRRQAEQNKPKEEPVALGMQLRKAKSINAPVTFDNGEKHVVHHGHADAFENHMAARKTTQEKAAFQKRASKSHEEFKKAVSEPLPNSKGGGSEVVKYRH